MTPTRRALSALIVTGTTTSALFLAEGWGGPIARAVLGVPSGFDEDFTSPAAVGRALLVQGASVALALFVLGIIVGWRFKGLSYKDAVWATNPITVGVGFAIYKWAYHSLHSSDYLAEYDSPQILVLFCIAAPLLFACCFYAGARILRTHHL